MMMSERSAPFANAERDEERLVYSSNAAIVLPAGAGKTELIARAVGIASETKGRQLILTHTHAGVHALKARLNRLGVRPQSYSLTTIASWALRWAIHYPSISGLTTAQPTSPQEWQAVYEGAVRVLANPHLASSVRESFGGVFVDEYQDCTSVQHAIALALGGLLPIRILGDPLQGIFGFTGDQIVWSRDVEQAFVQLDVEVRPWRWSETNPELGEWLLELRHALLNGRPINLATAPVNWKSSTSAANQVAASRALATDDTPSVVAILKWPNQCHSLAKKLGGEYSSMDELEGKDLLKLARAMDNETDGLKVAAELLRIARECMTGLPPPVRTAQKNLEAGQLPRINARTSNVAFAEAVHALAEAPTPHNLLAAIASIEAIPGVFVHRNELWQAIKRSISVQRDEQLNTIHEAAITVRDRTRENGRAAQPRTVSRTLLVKGLEYDHAVILDAASLDAQDFYVAATRGRRSLTILSNNRVLQFPTPSL